MAPTSSDNSSSMANKSGRLRIIVGRGVQIKMAAMRAAKEAT